MKTKKLEIEPTDILNYISITGTWIQCVNSEADGYINPDKIFTIAQETESRVFSALPEKYRRVCAGQINGLILCQWARGGETEFTLPDGLINNVKNICVYKNLPCDFVGFKPSEKQTFIYELRTPEYEFLDYTFTNLSGKLVLSEPLESGDNLICDVNYISSKWVTELVEVAKKLAASNVIPALPLAMDNGLITVRQGQLYQDAYGFLSHLSPEVGKAAAGIASIDELPIVREEKIRKTFSLVPEKPFWS